MAIEVTNFNYPTVPNSNIDEVYDWLVANASEYFPGGIRALIDTMRIVCYLNDDDNGPRIVIPFRNNTDASSGYLIPAYATEIYRWNPNATSYTNNAYSKAAKTNSGIMLLSTMGMTLTISRTINGSVCAFTSGGVMYNSTSLRFMATDLENDIQPITTDGANLTYSQYMGTYRVAVSAAATVLLPVTFNCGTHSESMFVTPITQTDFISDLQKVLIDGQEYIYDGFVALKA